MNCSYTPLLIRDNLLCKWSILIVYKIGFYSDTNVVKQHKANGICCLFSII